MTEKKASTGTLRPSFGPTSEKERILSLDLLRGFAVLGILVMNIQSFSMIAAAYLNPTAYGDFEGANFAVWLVSHLLADLKFMAIFSMLFGAGIVLMWERAEASGKSSVGLHYHRMFWLILLGLLHAHLLWFGDILFIYGVCGLILCFFRKMKPKTLMILGLLLLVIGSSVYLLGGLSMPLWGQEQIDEFNNNTWAPNPELVAEEVGAYQGSWLEQQSKRVKSALEMEFFVFPFLFFWRVGGLMLIGMSLYKSGVFSGARSQRFYSTLIGLGLLVGLPVILYGASYNIAIGWPPVSLFVGSLFNYWGSILVSLGWIGLVMTCYLKGWLRGLQSRLMAVGRMALSNYLLETLICTTIFYGHGLGLFGQVERVGQAVIVIGVWVVLLLISPWWLSRFRYGPFEWLWRSLSYWRILPIRQ
jgi:uncharacterized protein